MYEVDAALQRAEQEWSPDISHVDAEAAYRDRTLLASEVEALRTSVAWFADALARAEAEIDRLMDGGIPPGHQQLTFHGDGTVSVVNGPEVS